MTETIIFSEQNLDFTTDNIKFQEDLGKTIILSVSETYRVTWNGSEYICTAAELQGAAYIGNAAIMSMGEDTGEPFVIAYMLDGSECIIATSILDIHNLIISQIEINSELILIEQNISGFLSDNASAEASNSVVSEKIYSVSWDGAVYTVLPYTIPDAPEGVFYLGNQALIDWEINGAVGDAPEIIEPFIIGFIPVEVAGEESALIYCSCTEESCQSDIHRVGIVVFEEPNGIVIRDPLGRAVTYGEYSKLLINRANGTKSIYSEGDAEAGNIVLDFSKGDMNLKPDIGKLWSKVYIKKPETLTSNNIIQNVNIAGVIGEVVISEEKQVSVSLDFANNDVMTITPEEGFLFSQVDVEKPENLVPENIALGVNIAGIEGQFSGGSDGDSFDFSDINLKWLTYQLDPTNKIIYLYSILYDKLYENTGSCDVTIPNQIGGFDVIIVCT